MKSRPKSATARSAEITDVLVVGAGAFGGWTAFFLRLQGLRVTLVDAWGPANPRASSGGATRILRSGYGTDEGYSLWSRRSLKEWKRWERAWGSRFFYRTGVLWLAAENEQWEAAIYRTLRKLKIAVERLPMRELRRRYPQLSLEGLSYGVFEPEAGVLMARRACRAVVNAFQKAGGSYQTAWAEPGHHSAGRLSTARLGDGAEIQARNFVFACGAWLPKIFPRVLGDRIRPTKQDVFFFGPPQQGRLFSPPNFPVWLEFSHEIYGIPSIEGQGFKIALDRRGPRFDPTEGDRRVSTKTLSEVRRFLTRRFPAMRDQPVVATEVCQYEQTADSHFIIDRHPELENVWLVGGGSGHGFKHGPIVGRLVAGQVARKSRETIPDRFRLQSR